MLFRFIQILLCLQLMLWSPALLAQGVPATTESNPMREMILSCTYGVLAGTLVGAASLAFTERPGDNLQRVARGASLGLYIGILLGMYVVYVVPGQIQEEQEKLDQQGLPPGALPYEQEGALLNRMQIYPIISEKGIDGLAGQFTLMSF